MDRIGVDVGKRMRLEDALEWAGKTKCSTGTFELAMNQTH
jgi:hypothetical protein